MQTTTSGVIRQMVYDNFGQLLAEYKQGALDKEYIYRGGQLFAINEVIASGTDLALGKTPSQSSTFVNAGVTFYANRAVDGNTNGDFWGGNTTSSTNYEYQPWWQVDLGSSQSMGTIQVWPRTDCCPEMSSNFYVLVSDNPFTSTDLNTTLNQSGVSSYYVSGYGGAPATVTVNRMGRYVRVQKSDTQFLVLAEVQIWGSSGSGGLKYVMQDLQGSTRAVMNNNGSSSTILARYDEMPFGEQISAGTGLRTTAQSYSVTQNVRHRYASTESDDTTGLDHTWWRKYESFSGRWTTPDPDLGSMTTGDPQSFNRYNYVQNDPVNFSDPTGLTMILDCLRLGSFEGSTYYTCDLISISDPVIHFSDPKPGPGGGHGGNPHNTAQNRRLDPSHPECQALAQKIANIQSSIISHTSDLIHNPMSLQDVSPTGKIKDGVTEHRDRLVKEAENLADKIQEYKDKCGGGNPPTVPPVNAPRSSRSRSTNFPNGQNRVLTPEVLIPVGVGVAVVACIAFWEVCLPVAGTAAAVP